MSLNDLEKLWQDTEAAEYTGLTEGDHEGVIQDVEVTENQFGKSIHYYLQFPSKGDKIWQKFTPLSGKDEAATKAAFKRAKTELKKLGVEYSSLVDMYDKLADDVVGIKLIINCKSRGKDKPGFWFNFIKMTGRDRNITEAQAAFGQPLEETTLLVD